MAYFEGTLDEFYVFLGARTSDLVTKIARPRRKEQKSCKQLKEDGSKCGKYTKLDAAHLKGRTRKEIIQEILQETGEFNNQNNSYKINIADFEERFISKHDDFFSVIEFMCRKHHKAYDTKNKLQNIGDDYIEVAENEIDNSEIDFGSDTKQIKSSLINHIDYLTKDNCVASRISKDIWNLNPKISQLKKDCYLLCFNQYEMQVIVLKMKANEFDYSNHIKKSDKTKISINILYSEEELIEKKMRYTFEYIETIKLS